MSTPDLRYTSDAVSLWSVGKCGRCGVDVSEPGRMCVSCKPMRRVPDVDRSWDRDALCAQTDPDVFFPVQVGLCHTARSICEACPVIAECLDYALTARMVDGVWGGLTATERAAILRRRARTGRAA